MNRLVEKGFTLIELLIVIAIILILIAIALPNFLEAQARAKVGRTKADMRSVATAIEAFRTERGVLLIDFWDDGTFESGVRWAEKFGRVGPNPASEYQKFDHVFYPLTSPVAYLINLPIDPWNDPTRQVGFGAREVGLAYIYFDNDVLVNTYNGDDHSVDLFRSNPAGGPSAGQVLYGIQPLRVLEFGLLSVGPDRVIGQTGPVSLRGLPYSPTNGTVSGGDLVFRSGGMVSY